MKLISFLRGAIQRLNMNDMLPPHMPYLIYQMFQTLSCDAFNSFFASLYARKQADVAVAGTTLQLDIETLFNLADQQYRTHVKDGTWVKKTKRGSGFLAGTICWYCKKEGHVSKDCRKKTADKKSGKDTSSTAKKGSGNAANGKDQPWKKAPGPGEPTERMHKNKKEYWCGVCKCWNRTHPTENHKTKAELKAAREDGTANVGTGNPPTGPPDTDSLGETGSVSNAAFLSNGFS